MISPVLPPRTLAQRIRFVAVAFALILVLFIVILPIGAGAGFIGALVNVGCGGGGDPSRYGLDYEAVAFASDWGMIPAYWVMPTLNAGADGYSVNDSYSVIIVVPTGSAGRGDRLDEFVHYVRAGYAVLTYDSPNCAIGARINSLGAAEVPLVGSALAWLNTRDDVDQNRIGLHGFSAGGATAIMAAARYPQIRAVVAEGGYADFGDEIHENTRSVPVVGGLVEWGARLGYRLSVGAPIETLCPLCVIDAITPRAILLIYGTNEPGLRGARMQLERARASGNTHADLWVVAGATHGSYVYTAPEEYAARIVEFMDQDK